MVIKKVGILYHPQLEAARALADKLEKFLSSQGISAWLCSAWEEEEVRSRVSGSDLVISIGGDGTILRVARAVVFCSVPILGINLGKLGFMTELGASEALDKLPALLGSGGWIEERAMLEVKSSSDIELHALNDVVVGRGALARVVYVETRVNNELLTTYKADGVIVATASGSTGYSLAAGGPILEPEAKNILLQPIAPHLSLSYAMVLPSTAVIELQVISEVRAILSIDGQVNLPFEKGDRVKIKLSPYITRFLRTHPPSYFYSSLEEKLKGKKDN